jgi:hypothetical protein
MGQSWLQAWSILAHYDQGVSVLTKNLNNPILKQKASMLDDALLRYRPTKLEWQHMKIADDYLPQLKKDSEVLNTALHLISNKISIDSFADLGPALDDMYFKVNACLLNNGIAVGSVSVKVHTKRSGVEVSNWRVFYMAKILLLYSGPSPTVFPQLSSPTQWELAPGNYIMWAEDPDTAKKSVKQEIPVDRNQECDLAVP